MAVYNPLTIELLLDHVVHGNSLGIASHMRNGRGMFQACSPKNNAKLVMLGNVNSRETMEGKIQELEKCVSIEIRILKVGIVIRQPEEGPMRTRLIMTSHRLAAFQTSTQK